jgi:hypothetical protein
MTPSWGTGIRLWITGRIEEGEMKGEKEHGQQT